MEFIIGVDEAGRGPLAGSVYAAAVLYEKNNQPTFPGINDSKKLAPKKRDLLYDEIKSKSVYSSIQFSTVAEIDSINILQASLLAMKRAIEKVVAYIINTLLAPISSISKIYIDGNQSPVLSLPYQIVEIETVVQGDALIPIISAASILAKVERDREMQSLSLVYPEYFFEKHKGYGTRLHIEALNTHGPCEIHRKSFAPVRRALQFAEAT